MKPAKPCKICPHLFQKDFDGIPYWRCNRPNEQAGRPRGRPGRYIETMNWLQEYLKNGPKPSGDRNKPRPDTLFGDAFALGFKYATIRRAAEKLGIRKSKEANSRYWFWALPKAGE